MLRYLYTSDYNSALPMPTSLEEYENSPESYGTRWGRHLELAIVADKYGATRLKETALERLEIGDSLESTSDIAKFVSRTQDLPVEQERLDQVVLHACADRFVDCFKHASFRAWLAERPELRDDLCSANTCDLLNLQAFHDLLKEDGEFAVRMLQLLSQRYTAHLRNCKSPGGSSPMPAPLPANELEQDSDTDEDDDDDSLDEDYESCEPEDSSEWDEEDEYYEYEYEEEYEDEDEDEDESQDVGGGQGEGGGEAADSMDVDG